MVDLPALLAGDADADIQLEAGIRCSCGFQHDFCDRVTRYSLITALPIIWILPRGQRCARPKKRMVRANGGVQRFAMKTSLLSFAGGANGLEPGDTIIVPVDEIPTYVGAVQRGVDGCVPKYRLSLPAVQAIG